MSSARNADSLQNRTDRLAEGAGDAIRQIGDTVEGNLQEAGASLVKAQKQGAKQVKVAAEAAEDYVHENPWKSIVFAGVAGLLVGLMCNIRR